MDNSATLINCLQLLKIAYLKFYYGQENNMGQAGVANVFSRE